MKRLLILFLSIAFFSALYPQVIRKGSSDSLSISWPAVTTNIKGNPTTISYYNVKYEKEKEVFSDQSEDTTYVFTGLASGKYVFGVSAVDTAGRISLWRLSTDPMPGYESWVYQNTLSEFVITIKEKKWWFFDFKAYNHLGKTVDYIELTLADSNLIDWLSNVVTVPDIGKENNDGVYADHLKIMHSLAPGDSLITEGDLDGASTGFWKVDIGMGSQKLTGFFQKSDSVWKAVIPYQENPVISLADTTPVNLLLFKGTGEISEDSIVFKGAGYVNAQFEAPVEWRYDMAITAVAPDTADLYISSDNPIGHHRITGGIYKTSFIKSGVFDLRMEAQSPLRIDGIIIYKFIPIPGDINLDGRVDGIDLMLLANKFGQSTHSREDINGNGIVDGTDLAILGQNFGRSK